MFKNALVSVSDKTGLAEFLGPLMKSGMRVVSSGGTAKYLEDHGLAVTKVSEQTGFPEVMGGRVKTLHPKIHMPLLYRSFMDEDKEVLQQYDLEPFDLVVVNLYPFARGLAEKKNQQQMVELIDIGGPTLLRAAAKNFSSICVVSDPEDYQRVGQEDAVTDELRRELAGKVFRHVSGYDSKIADYLTGNNGHGLAGEPVAQLRYGENPQQDGFWYQSQPQGLHSAKILQGKPLSYNNLVDLDGACRTLAQFSETTVVSVKHNNPCGIAQGQNIAEATQRSLKADPVSVFGGIIAANREVDEESAQALTALFLECVIAPSYSEKALKVLANKKNLRLLQWEDLLNPQPTSENYCRSILGGYLVQTADSLQLEKDKWDFLGHNVDEQTFKNLKFAWKACASLKSNAIAICSGTQTIGLGMGQVNRVDAVKQAVLRARDFHGDCKNWVLASDAFFPFADSIEIAAEAGVQWVVQPGGSIRDDEVRAAAEKHKIKMAFTGQRHFLH